MKCWKSNCHRIADVQLVLAVFISNHVYIPRCSEHWEGLSEAQCEMHFFEEQANAELITKRLVNE